MESADEEREPIYRNVTARRVPRKTWSRFKRATRVTVGGFNKSRLSVLMKSGAGVLVLLVVCWAVIYGISPGRIVVVDSALTFSSTYPRDLWEKPVLEAARGNKLGEWMMEYVQQISGTQLPKGTIVKLVDQSGERITVKHSSEGVTLLLYGYSFQFGRSPWAAVASYFRH